MSTSEWGSTRQPDDIEKYRTIVIGSGHGTPVKPNDQPIADSLKNFKAHGYHYGNHTHLFQRDEKGQQVGGIDSSQCPACHPWKHRGRVLRWWVARIRTGKGDKR